MRFAAVHESAYGTKRTSHDVCYEVGYWVKSGRQILRSSISAFDPSRTSAPISLYSSLGRNLL